MTKDEKIKEVMGLVKEYARVDYNYATEFATEKEVLEAQQAIEAKLRQLIQ